ncbi:MAG: hypothetical protein HUK05_08425, partial [Prevotella sp.]|nr:hypothetical protein [Prevotella sp.]
MKRTILTLLFMFALTLCFASNVIVKNPFYEGKNTEVIEITQVEISDKATTLNVHAHFQPKYWIKIVSATTLIADGKQYALKSAEGIQHDSLFWMPDSGEADFKLIFQPMPKNTSQFNFCEGNEEGAFRIWGIDLTGKVNTGFPIGLPEALKKKPTDGSLPAPIFESGHTKITFHLLADKMALEKEYTLYVNTIFGTQQEKAMKFNSDGVATVEFDQDGTAYCVAVSNYHALVSFWVAPGDNMDVYIDGRVEGYIYQMNKQDPPKSNPNGYAYFTGHYADLNRIADMCRFESVGNDEEYEMSYKMTGDEFMAELSRYYTAAVNNLKAQPCPQMMKEMTIATYQQGVIYAFCHTNSLLYTYSQGSRTALPKDSLNVRLTEKHAKQLANLFDCNSPSLLMGDVLDALFSKSNEMEALYAVSPLLKSLNTAASYMQL